MNFGDLEPGRPKNKYDSLPDYHLQNPLYSIKTTLDSYKKRKRLPKRTQAAFKALKSRGDELLEGDPHTLLKLFLDIRHQKDHDLIDATIRDCHSRVQLEQKAPEKLDVSDLSLCLEALRANFPITLWDSMRWAQEMLLVFNALSSRRPLPTGYIKDSNGLVNVDIGGTSFLITGAFFCYIQDGKTMLHDGDWLRSVSDTCTERFLLHIASTMGRNLNPDHYPRVQTIWEVINWGDQVLSVFGNDGFKVIKAYEALCLGVLQERGRGDFVDSRAFLLNTLADLRADSLAYGAWADQLVEILESIREIHHLTQLYGMHRIWGHPLVNAAKGAEKMLIIGQKDIMQDTRLPEIAGVHFKKMICQGYRAKRGVYPNVQPDEHSRLVALIQNNEEWNIVSDPEYDTDWEALKFAQTFMIPESFNLSMIVADKSVSLTRSELKHNILTKGTVMSQELRRGVLRWINNETIDPRTFLQEVNRGEFPDDHKIIGMRSKERELNPTPRMFSLMGHLMRVYVVVTESMLSDHILPFFPQVTMTDSLLDLTKKMYTSVRGQTMWKGNKSSLYASKTVCMSLDFEKWNGHMRKEATFHVFSAMGELFGLDDLYNQTYDIFRESYFYIADGSYVPELDREGNLIPNPPQSYTGHKGGQEGLRQKGWTIFTVVILDWICLMHNCTFKIMGMGDNQVLLLTFYTNKTDAQGRATERGLSEMRRCLENLFQDLVDHFNDLGLPLKPLETWISEDLFVYGKYPIWRGVPMTMDMKKMMRIFPFSNLEIMTVENILNTIAGNSQAATQASPCLGVAYLVGIFMSFLSASDLLDYHPLLGKGLLSTLKESKEWGLRFKGSPPIKTQITAHIPSKQTLRRLMVSVPRVLGGYVSINLFSTLMRGFPDPVSLALSTLYMWEIDEEHHEDPFSLALSRWLKPLYMPERSMKLLVEDVASVNLLAPVTPTAGLRQAVEEYLRDGRVIKNTEFRELMQTRDPDIEEVLARHFCKGDNLHIRLIHDIMEATIFGYVKSITSKVTKSSTIVGLAVGNSRGDPLAKVMNDEENYFKFFIWRSLVQPEYELPNCPTELAKKLRFEGWGKSLIGVTVAFPWSYLQKTNCHEDGATCQCEDGFISAYLPDSVVTSADWNNTIGKNPPYLGSMTKEKVIVASGSKIYSSEPLIRRPINLMRVIGWFVPEESATAEIIRACVRAVSDIDPYQFQGVAEGTSGSEIHRFKDTSLKHGALCSSNFLYSTRYHVSTDTFSRYAKGAQNFDMMFQANLCAIIESLHLRVVKSNRNGSSQPKSNHYKQVCYQCINPLDETFYDLEESRAAALVPSKKANSYLYVSSDKVSMVREITPMTTWIQETLSSEEYHAMSNGDRLLWLTDCVVDNICIDLMSSSGEESFMTTALMDIKEHNRLFYLTVKPKDVFLQLCNRIMAMAEWRCLSKSEWKIPTVEATTRAALAILGDTSLSKWSGMSGFFSWPSSMQVYYFCPEIIEPDTIPITTLSACKSIKNSLTGLLGSMSSFPNRNSYVLPEETKGSNVVLKLMLYSWVRERTECQSCRREVGVLSSSKLSRMSPENIRCALGHFPFNQYRGTSIMRSRVTMDSLRKDCQDLADPIQTKKEPTTMLPLSETTCTPLFDGTHLAADWIRYQPSGITMRLRVLPIETADLYKILSLPTNAQYKYLELFSHLLPDLNKTRKCLMVGNGLGGSSRVLVEMWPGDVWVSTLLSPEDSIPQVYPHCNKGFKSFQHSRIHSDEMIDRVNDITHSSWSQDWRPLINSLNMDLLVSDVEINDKESSAVRSNIISTLLRSHEWSICVIKDYIYSLAEFEERLSLITLFTKKFQLVTCNSRQRVMPEVWWICVEIGVPSTVPLGLHRSVLLQSWESLRESINTESWNLPEIMAEMNKVLLTPSEYATIMIKLRSWATLPIIGECLPFKGTYTRLLGYLQRGKRPADVAVDSGEGSGRKLYQSDYLALRSVLFGLAVSMVASIVDRAEIISQSRCWVLDWKPSSPRTWLPFLTKKEDTDLPEIHVYDWIPALSILMRRENLLFKRYNNIIEFRFDRKRDFLCFPITKAASIKFEL